MNKKKINIKIMYQNGKKVGVILKEKQLDDLIEELEDLYDRKTLLERSMKKERTYTHEEIVAETRARMHKK